MTLIIAATSPKSIWMLTDRRLSFNDGSTKDDARKMMTLTTMDGHALLGYAGLGSTANNTEPSDWMARVLRGRNLPLEQSLEILTSAATDHLPSHLKDIGGGAMSEHHIIIAAFLHHEPRLYSISLVQTSMPIKYRFRLTRHVTPAYERFNQQGVVVAIAGSGGYTLDKDRRPWAKELKKIIKAHDRGKITPQAVARYLAGLNYYVHCKVNTVGGGCRVAWFGKGGGNYQLFTGTSREVPTDEEPRWPSILEGNDVNAFMGVVMPRMAKLTMAVLRNETAPEIDNDAFNAALRELPDTPDESLS